MVRECVVSSREWFRFKFYRYIAGVYAVLMQKLRSPTAESVFGVYPGHECDSAGLNDDAVQPPDGEQVRRAEIIFVMESAHRARLNRRFRTAL